MALLVSRIHDPTCRRCLRLAEFLDQTSDRFPGYWCQPVPSFGDPNARLLIVGLAPGMHGANASGRPFTGDHAGILLYKTLYRLGFSTHQESRSATDSLELENCRITNAVRCLPPQNKPTQAEVNNCNNYLAAEIGTLPVSGVVLALGRLAHNAVLKAVGVRQSAYPFRHAAEHQLDALRLVDTYHCSRYNTQTRRLTEAMFFEVMARARQLVDAASATD